MGWMFLLEWALRLFGLFWIMGGAFTLRQARQSRFMDVVLEQLTQEREDPLVTRFLWLGGILTILSGVGLAIASRWGLIPLGLLVASQAIYFRLKQRRFAGAKTEDEREEARITPSTRNAFAISGGVTALALMGVHLGVLR